MGRFERSIAGEQQADKLLIVRYPSHRRFLAMTLNPYYLAINRLREAGVRRFEASFTHASHSERRPGTAALAGRACTSTRHAGEDALDCGRELATPLAGELVYATRASATLGFLDPPADTDPNPLTFGELALFAPRRGSGRGRIWPSSPASSSTSSPASRCRSTGASRAAPTAPPSLPGTASVDAQPA